MPLGIEVFKELFKDYLLNDKAPLRINLPRDLVFELVGKYMLLEKIKAESKDWQALVDITWYFDKSHEAHPFSHRNSEHQCQAFEQEYEQWRAAAICGSEEKHSEPLVHFRTVGELLEKAAARRLPVTVGESHEDFTPKAIFMHNLALLKKQKAVVFCEFFRKELQAELEISLLQRRPTQLMDVYLSLDPGSLIKPKAPFYSDFHLVRRCIQEGIPVVGCEANISLQVSSMGSKKSMGVVMLVSDQGMLQVGDIARTKQHYEYAKSLEYARRQFPDHDWHLTLVGFAHSYTYSVFGDRPYPSIVDLMGGIYIHARDALPEVSQEIFYEELSRLVPVAIINQDKEAMDKAFFVVKRIGFSDVPKKTGFLCNMEQVIAQLKDEAGKLVYTEAQVKKIMEALHKKYCPPVQVSPPGMDTELIRDYVGRRKAGYLVQAYSPNTLNERPAKAAPVMVDFGAKLDSGLGQLGVFARPPLASGKPKLQTVDELLVDKDRFPEGSLRFPRL